MTYSINTEYTPLINPIKPKKKCKKLRNCKKCSLISLGIFSLISSILWITIDLTTNFQYKLSYTYPDSNTDLTLTYSTFFYYSNNYVELNERENPSNSRILIPDTTKFDTLPPSSRYIHRLEFNDLKYNSEYDYSVKIGNFPKKKYSFQTANKNQSAWNVLIYGDMGVNGDTTRPFITNRIRHDNIDFFLHLGDIAYNLEWFFGIVGDWYLSSMEPASAVKPYMTVAGNHEQYMNFSNYYNRFTMPYRNISNNLWYNIDKPPIKFININSESFYYSFQEPTVKNLLNFINASLYGIDRTKFPWVIVSAHRPMYCSSDNTDDCTHWKTDKVRTLLEKLFYERNVTIYMSAHEHSYERTCPLYNGKCQRNTRYNKSFNYNNLEYPIHIINGGSGNHEGNSGFIKNPEVWSVIRNRAKSYGVLFANYTYLNWTEYGITPDKKDQEVVIDWIEIKN